ncbi:MAG: PAS domain-containing protein [Bryobacterales bacterium]|nr:PAS domain-containing protein [Bryobacterales bacterium]
MRKDASKARTVRTTIRLTPDLHKRIKSFALDSGITLEDLVERALKREVEGNRGQTLSGGHALDLYDELRKVLDRFHSDHEQVLGPVRPVISDSTEWSPLLAYRFLQSATFPAVIKNSKLQIVWCNMAYEEHAEKPLAQIKGKTASQLGLVDAQSEKVMEQVLSRGKEVSLEENVQTKRGERVMRVHLFAFKDPNTNETYLGDLSFDLSASVSAPKHTLPPPDSQALRLFQPFLEQCPTTSVAIKDRHRRIVWCDSVYLRLTPGPMTLEEVKGKTAEEIFGIGPFDAITVNDQAVIDKEQAMLFVEKLPGRGPRASVRFPIYNSAKQVQLIGAISAAYKLEELDVRPPSTRKRSA